MMQSQSNFFSRLIFDQIVVKRFGLVWFGLEVWGNFQSTKIFFAMTEGGRFLTVSKKTVLLLATCCSSQWEAATKTLTITITITITITTTVLLLAACCSTRWGAATKTPLTKMGFSLTDESVSSHVSGNLTRRSQSEPKKAHHDAMHHDALG